MRDVAALAGVSLKTVSRVVNGVETVDPTMAAKVNTAAAKLGYRPNLTASSLRRSDRRTSTIGLLVEDAANPFSSSLIRAVEDVAQARGVFVLIGSLDEDPTRERMMVIALIDRRVDGLVVVPAGSDHSYLVAEREAGTRVVFLDREATQFEADAVVSGNEEGALAAVRHLLDGGHTRIGYLGDRLEVSTARQRFAGYRRALEVAHVELDESLVRHLPATIDAGIEVVNEWLGRDNPPTALFSSQNLLTIGATRALHRLGRQREVGLVGFDDFPMADVLDPGVTVIAQDTERLGGLAAEILFARLDGDETPSRTHVVPTRLVTRGSGEIPGPGRI